MYESKARSLFASIIIPIRAIEVEQREIKRLHRLLSIIPYGYEVIIVDDGSKRKVKRYLAKMIDRSCSSFAKIQLISLNTRWRHFSLARARNRGLLAASSPVTIFHDVDFIGCKAVYERIRQYIIEVNLAENPQNFFCLPVAFLTEESTNKFLKGFDNDVEIWDFRNKSIDKRKDFEFIVLGSSAIVAQRKDLLDIGGHDEGFKGHGAEDFELLHRLGMRYPVAVLPPEYTRNMGSGNISEYRGFRAYFALYGEKSRQAGITLVHLWHPKRSDKGYYRHRKNFTRLRKIMENGSPSNFVDKPKS